MVVVTAGIIERDGQILIAQRKKGSRLEYKWELPGGKLEEGETPEECLVRELHEEFGVETRVKSFFGESKYTYSYISIDMLAYRVEYLGGEFRLNSHEQFRWVHPSELSQFDFAEADKPLIEKLRRRARFTREVNYNALSVKRLIQNVYKFYIFEVSV
jgi:8-oxo-dGTP diphosphatase